MYINLSLNLITNLCFIEFLHQWDGQPCNHGANLAILPQKLPPIRDSTRLLQRVNSMNSMAWWNSTGEICCECGWNLKQQLFFWDIPILREHCSNATRSAITCLSVVQHLRFSQSKEFYGTQFYTWKLHLPLNDLKNAWWSESDRCEMKLFHRERSKMSQHVLSGCFLGGGFVHFFFSSIFGECLVD